MGMMTQGMNSGGGSPITSTQRSELAHLTTYGDNPSPPLTATNALSALFFSLNPSQPYCGELQKKKKKKRCVFSLPFRFWATLKHFSLQCLMQSMDVPS